MSNNLNPYPGQQQAAAVSEADVRRYLLSVFNLMAGGLVLTGLVAYAGVMSGIYQKLLGTPLIYVVIFAPLGLVIYLSSRIQQMSVATAQICYWVYASLVGLSMGFVFLVYTGESIMNVFFITAGTFGAMSIFGYTTRADLSGMGSFLMMGLIGIIIASVVNLFMHSDAMGWIISVIGVIVFTGLTAYDVNKLKAFAVANGPYGEMADKGAIMGALSLYLDFINLFMMLLRLMGNRR